MRYRFPYHMFMKWFVPYSPAGALAMAMFLLPTLFFLLNALLFSSLSVLAWRVLAALQLVAQWWGSYLLLSYHRPLVQRQWLLANGVATALIFFQYWALGVVF